MAQCHPQYASGYSMGEGVSKFLGVRRIFAQISPNLPEKTLQKMTSKKRLHVISCVVHFFQSRHFKHRFCPNFTQTCPNFY